MKLTSKSFEQGTLIPSKFTCDGNNTNPALEFKDVPANAKSLVLIMDDPDIPAFVKEKYSIQVWDHWVVFNIPAETRAVNEGSNPKGLFGVNTGGKKTYGGPCPPDKEHRYFFKLYALDTMLSLKEGATKKEVEQAMEGHILAKAELMGLYERKK
ncbi:YbhB/YbcL family Raf kinase inhibitor-like protein [Candidatus Woesearchaeota archaeon]|nr:YbhB/YbcL family Raf kinase inhibitor-like protein [Candidatus Woesearchaeota archaeon]